SRHELRRLGEDLVLDGPILTFANNPSRFHLRGEELLVGDAPLKRVEVPKPDPTPGRWAGLIGEYGWDHDVLYIAEKGGKLHALIEWFFSYPLEEIAPDVFRFPDSGLYDRE